MVEVTSSNLVSPTKNTKKTGTLPEWQAGFFMSV